MKELKDLTDGELVNWAYSDLAGQFIRDNVKDWTNREQLSSAVNKLSEPAKTIYLIGILNQQVMNGGFVQYYDNSYGRFAYETLEALKNVGAYKTFALLGRSLELINPDRKVGTDFMNLIIKRGYPTDAATEGKLNDLANEYYVLDDTEDLIKLLADYLRQRLTDLK